MTTRLEHFTHKARGEPELKFTALMDLLTDELGLAASFERQDGKKAPGVDGVTNLYPMPAWKTQAGSRMV